MDRLWMTKLVFRGRSTSKTTIVKIKIKKMYRPFCHFWSLCVSEDPSSLNFYKSPPTMQPLAFYHGFIFELNIKRLTNVEKSKNLKVGGGASVHCSATCKCNAWNTLRSRFWHYAILIICLPYIIIGHLTCVWNHLVLFNAPQKKMKWHWSLLLLETGMLEWKMFWDV